MVTKKSIVLIVTNFCVVDFVLSTLFFIYGLSNITEFAKEIANYTFSTSMFDTWVLSLFRFSVLLGALIGAANNPKDAQWRLQIVQTVVQLFVLISCIFIVIKLILYAEVNSDLRQIYFWLLFSWTIVASFGFHLFWKLISSIPVEKTEDKKFLRINSEDFEHTPLLKPETLDDNEKEEVKNYASIKRLLSYSAPDILYISLGFFFLTCAAVGQIFIPRYTGQVIDGIAIQKSQTSFVHAIIIMSVISIGSAVASGLRGGCFTIAITRFNIRIRKILFTSIVHQEIGFFDTTKTGDVTSRLTADTTVMSDAIALNINIFLRCLIKAIGVCVFMFYISWQLTLITMVGLPLVFFISEHYGNYYKKLQKEVQDSLAKANDVAEEVCSSMRTVRSFANENGEAEKYANKLQVTYKLNIKQAIAYAGYTMSTEIIELALAVCILYYGGHLVVTGRLSGGQLISFILYQWELGDAIEGISNVYTGLMQAVGASHKVIEWIDKKPKISNNGILAPDHLHGKVEFKNVTFAYPSRPESYILTDVSFVVNPGEVVALVGPSGGGKTSCVNLIEHFYEPSSGEVLLDSKPVKDYDHKYLHQKIALVGQEPILYARSIRENIAYGMETIENDDVTHAAMMANSYQFVREMKDGFETETGEKGVQLSGGQKQRIAIARALIRNPVILLLDEATSALDSESEFVVQQAILKNLSNRTVLLIAHRLSTVEKADRIIVIDKGRVAEEGTHYELLSRQGVYANLVYRQMLDPRHVLESPEHRSVPRRLSDLESDSDEPRTLKYGSL